MMEPKYEILDNDTITIYDKTLHRIRALKTFGDVRAGDMGGYIEKYGNLSQVGNAWVYGNAQVYGNAWVHGNAWVCGNAQVYGNAWVHGNAWVCGNAIITETRDYMCFGSFGSSGRTTTIFRTNSGIGVRCGCFYGNLEEFREKVKETHKDNGFAKEYLAIADIAAMRFEGGVNNADDVRVDR